RKRLCEHEESVDAALVAWGNEDRSLGSNHFSCERERRVLAEDRLLQLLERGTRLDPQLVDEVPPRRLVRLQRLRLPAGAVEREHQLAAQAFSERMPGDQLLELADDLRVTAVPEIAVDALLE